MELYLGPSVSHACMNTEGGPAEEIGGHTTGSSGTDASGGHATGASHMLALNVCAAVETAVIKLRADLLTKEEVSRLTTEVNAAILAE